MLLPMRSETEMRALILGFAQRDDRVRVVILNGSRASPSAPEDSYRDYDIVYIVTELESFTRDHGWIDVFGERLIVQMPEAMRDPSGEGHFNYLILLRDCNRIDLTLMPLLLLNNALGDSQSILLLDKDGIVPPLPAPSDDSYLVKPPSPLFYNSCCNNFWWCMQNVAKGIARDELPYAMMMLHTIVRAELHDMLAWYIGVNTGFSVTAGKMGKYFSRHLSPRLYAAYLRTYCAAEADALWASLFEMCGLFREAAQAVGAHCGYGYCDEDDAGMMAYLAGVRGA